LAISDDGNIIVGQADAGTTSQAFRWTSGTGMTALPNLPGGSHSWADGVSADGSVATGGAQNSHHVTTAVRWSSGGPTDLMPAFVDAGSSSAARAVSGAGDVVVCIFHSPNDALREDVAFIWTETTGMQYLSDVLDALGVDHSDWGLSEVSGISLDGHTIVGYGQGPDRLGQAFLIHLDSIPDVANVPEPGTALMLAIGTARLARRRRLHLP
jgi:probable HAF family extracellular repeat protein